MKFIIYKIQINDYIYIGSTQNFTIRKAAHKKDCNNITRKNGNLLVYRTIRDNGGWDCCTMVPIKEVDVETKTQARILEEEVRVEYNAQMNMIRAYRSESIESEYQKEYRQNPEFKEKQKEYQKVKQKEYQQTPEFKEKRKEYNKEYQKEYNKKYQQTPKYKEYQKQYRLARKANVAESPEIIVSE